MGQYLEKFADTIGKRQAQQILKVLNEKRNTGQIRTIDEFSKNFEDLIRELQSTVLTPSLVLWMANEDEFIDTETYNFMLDRVEDDLIASFEEATNIDKVQKSHEAIVRDVILKNLRAGVAELQAKITLYEFLNNDVRGFDSAIFTTFRESKENRTERSSTQAAILFNDPRTNLLIGVNNDAEVELVGERLILPNISKTQHRITNVRQIFNKDTSQSELVVEPAGTSLKNISDGIDGTYWIQSLIFKNKRDNVKVVLEFDLGTVREVNFIDIDPASRYGLILEDISFLDSNNSVTSLDITDQTIQSETSISIRKIATSKIVLSFRNDNPSRIQFEYDPNQESLFSQAVLQPPEGIIPTSTSASEDLNELLASSKIKDVLGLPTETKLEFSGYEFLTGLDNVRIGVTDFRSKGIYISTPLKICGAGQVGLRTVETRPFRPALGGAIEFTAETYDNNTNNEIDNPVTKGRNFQSSIEYWIVKQDLTTEGALVSTNIFPILPLGVQRVHQERLILNEKSATTEVNNDIGSLMFFTNRTNGDIKVYRNGTLIVDRTGSAVPADGWVAEPDNILVPTAGVNLRTPNNGSRMLFKIKVIDPLPGDIYTVTYSPILSSTKAIPKTVSELSTIGGVQVVDLVGDLSARSSEGQIILLDKVGEDDSTQDANIFLVIIMRQNTADNTISSAVEEYTLVAGCKDVTKFEGV